MCLFFEEGFGFLLFSNCLEKFIISEYMNLLWLECNGIVEASCFVFVFEVCLGGYIKFFVEVVIVCMLYYYCYSGIMLACYFCYVVFY